MLRPINPPGPSIPGLSNAMLIESGRLLLLSGHVPLDETGRVCAPDLATQLDQVFRNMSATLQAAGVGFEAVARLTLYIRDFESSLLPVIREVRDRWVDVERPPASSLIGVASLFHPEVLVEVDAFAVVPG
ncbi:RidA family protein [Paludibacterium purpuratum]|uniref:Enamine deaminase RidA (YjgF/YER057c/UK114 family) n=1 Tax=Paludibacterium purpuratum TaxID=1144873 RepID=A0A4R7B340_9NEIS|nr:RidA family protein [Paludibacterium purpuratum]TDR76440.1 enamine deaminase RidA (YjgF/YER057c/UK114 family) [Paludibacterium purpuratum]